MGLAKRKVELAPNLAEEILRLRGEIESFIDGKVAEAKRSASGSGLPEVSLRQMLTRGDNCLCRAAMQLRAEQGDVGATDAPL